MCVNKQKVVLETCLVVWTTKWLRANTR